MSDNVIFNMHGEKRRENVRRIHNHVTLTNRCRTLSLMLNRNEENDKSS